MKRKHKIIHGHGVNDADYNTNRTEIVNGKQKIVWSCQIYLTWRAMIRRCYCEKTHVFHPTYKCCSVSEEWLYFSNFREWMKNQDWEGKDLDKDILCPGNKVYSKSACIFVSRPLNLFLNSNKAMRGDSPLGTSYRKRTDSYEAHCSNPFTKKIEYLGLFKDPTDAHLAWKARKHELACIYADMQDDERVAEALRTRFAT